MLASAAYVTAQFWPDAQPEFPSQRLRPCDRASFIKTVNAAAKRVGLTDTLVLKFREEAIAWPQTNATGRTRLSLVRWLEDCQSPITLDTALAGLEQYADPHATWAIKAFLLRWLSFTTMRTQGIPEIRVVALAPTAEVAQAVCEAARLRFVSVTRGVVFGFTTGANISKGMELHWRNELHEANARTVRKVAADRDWYLDVVRYAQKIVSKSGGPPPKLSADQADALRALRELRAVGAETRKSAAEIMKKAGLAAADAPKHALAELVDFGYIASVTGRGGGYWLTGEGALLAIGMTA